MELATLSKNYGNFYAPAYAVRVGGEDIMRQLLVAVSQVEIDMMLGAASRFTFTVTDCYSHKLHAFQTGRGADLLKLLAFGTEVEICMGYGDAKSTPIAVNGTITEITTNFPESGSPELVIAGYDAAPIDGVDGPKTQAALAAFLKNRGLTADIVQSPNVFTTMIDAVQSPSPTGLTWCNDTPHKIMAAVATDDGKTVVSRGWYRIDPGKCLHPDVTGVPKQIFSFAEAVDAENRTLKFKDRPLNWGGTTQLCTRESKFEVNEQGDCGTRGLAVTGFAAVDMSSGGKTLRFAIP